jgi:hypothetical protein
MKNLPLPAWTCCLFLALTGCSAPSEHPRALPPSQAEAAREEAKIRRSLDDLGPMDRVRAETQKYCAVREQTRLGSRGTPIQIQIKGQPVFLCCQLCAKEARDNPERTLAIASKLKEKNAAPAAP